MPIIDPDQGVPTPAPADLANNPAAFTNFYTPVLSRLNLRYTDEANRTALHPANINGEESYLTASGRKEVNTGAGWLSGFGASMFASIRKSATETVNNSTALQNDDDFVVALPTSGTFGWSMAVWYSSSTVADIQFAFTWPAGAGAMWSPHAIATTGISDVQFGAQSTSGLPLPVGGNGATSPVLALLEGEITMGGTAGNLQFQWAQNTLEASNTQVRARSRMMVWRIAL
jgi:hypothetical protein